jgi:hypothetical protein
MKNIQPADPFLRHEFLKWYHVASVGQALQAVESAYLKSNLKLAYLQKTLQIGRLGSESRYIDSDFIGDYVLVDKKGPRSFPTFVQATAGALPFATESIDTVLLPHVLEFDSTRGARDDCCNGQATAPSGKPAWLPDITCWTGLA